MAWRSTVLRSAENIVRKCKFARKPSQTALAPPAKWLFPLRFPQLLAYLAPVRTLGDEFERTDSLTRMTVPDLWQQQAISALRGGQDVVVQAPTGAGKTLIFELWSNSGKPRGQVVYTVPTRALANDKLAEWRAKGWNVGIATGDLSDNLEAPIIVATLETQKRRLIRGEGPGLLVVDEYQLIGDPDRGLNYELALALAPANTQLLLLSGSVANPRDVVKWLNQLGRQAVLVEHDQRPVPLDEVYPQHLNFHLPSEIRTFWARFCARALADDLGPILIFAPQRVAAERMAAELARQLPVPDPLQLSPEQRKITGEHLARLLKSRIAYHHSGLSYGARAGVIEPLAKAGQLRVVVATMGLAAGINFSLRSVALAGESYKRGPIEHPLRPDEILQMFGRAGRRGLDETGYVLISPNNIRLLDSRPCRLSRSNSVDWAALLGIMSAAAEAGQDPFTEAVRVQERLFTSKPVPLGVEQALKHPDTPCGLKTDAERARRVRKRYREMLNSQGQWERFPKLQPIPTGSVKVGRPHLTANGPPHPPVDAHQARTSADLPQQRPGLPIHLGGHDVPGSHERQRSEDEPGEDRQALPLASVLSHPDALEKVGQGMLVELPSENGEHAYGRASTVADRLNGNRVVLAKWVRRLLNWHGRQVPLKTWEQKVLPRLKERLAQKKTPVVKVVQNRMRIVAHTSIADLPMRVPVDRHGVALWGPWEREVLPRECAGCNLIETCKKLPTATGTALLWRRLGLVNSKGIPTRRGQVVSCFHRGDGLAIAAALEDESYPIDELIYDLANLDAGFRFCGDDNRWAGRLALVCHERYGMQSVPGYLENGVPPRYGAGAEQVVAAVHQNPQSKHKYIDDLLGPGDIDRAIIEWRSLCRQISHAPAFEWPRWKALQAAAAAIVRETDSPTLTELPPLEYNQTRRIEHRLILRRR